MRKKGYLRVESPEKMPVITSGIQMSRTEPKAEKERLTGGNCAADEREVAKSVVEFIQSSE